MAHLNELIYFYFLLGVSHKDILLTLSHVDRIIISMRTLHWHLKHLRLYRWKNQTDLLEVALFLMNELDRYGKLHGYKLLHLKCIQAGFVVSQRVIRHLLGILDPDGVRRSTNKKESSLKTSDVWKSWPQFYVAHGLLWQTETFWYLHQRSDRWIF